MSLRLFKRITIIPGWLYLNLSKTGVSFSLRKRGASLTAGTKGVSGSVGAPGTGLYYRGSRSYSDLEDMIEGHGKTDDKQALIDKIEEQMNGEEKE